MSIDINSVIKNGFKFNIVNIISIFIAFVASIYVATVLTPEEFGIYGLLGLWLLYAGLIGPGFISASSREIPVLLGKNLEKDALKVQNVSLTAELIYLIIPCFIIFISSFFYTDQVIKIGLIIISINFLITKIVAYWTHINVVRQRFSQVAVGRFLIGFSGPIFLFISVDSLRVYALLIAPIVSSLIGAVYYFFKASLHFKITFDKKIIIDLLKVGVTLQFLSLIFWAFRLSDRTIIAGMLPIEELGLYVFAMTFIMNGRTIIGEVITVLQPIAWKSTGKSLSIFHAFKDLKKIGIYLSIGSAILVPLSQLGFYIIVSQIATNYLSSMWIFNILSYNLFFIALAGIPSIILNSSIVNRQKKLLLIYGVGLTLNIIFDIVIILMGFDLIGVGFVTVSTQALVTVLSYISIRKLIFENRKKFLRYCMHIFFPLVIIIPFYFVFYLNLINNPLIFSIISVSAQILIWTVIIYIFYRNYIKMSLIKSTIKMIIKRT